MIVESQSAKKNTSNYCCDQIGDWDYLTFYLTFILSGCFIESDVTTPANVSVHETPDETDNNPTQLEQITNSSTTGRHVEWTTLISWVFKNVNRNIVGRNHDHPKLS